MDLRAVSAGEEGASRSRVVTSRFEVVGLPRGEKAWVARVGRAWRVLRLVEGKLGDWRGRHESKESALEALEAELVDDLRLAIARLSPIALDGCSVELRLDRVVKADGPRGRIEVWFTGTDTERAYSGRVTVTEGVYATERLAELVAGTMVRIATGCAPPSGRTTP